MSARWLDELAEAKLEARDQARPAGRQQSVALRLEDEARAYRHAGAIVEALAARLEGIAAAPVPYEADSFRYRAEAFREAARIVRGENE